MLFSQGHGKNLPAQTIQPASAFAYFFPDADEAPFDDTTLDALQALHRDMVEGHDDSGANHASLPPVFTYFGQFIDHDITGVREDPRLTPIAADHLKPLPRSQVAASLMNLRTGRLDLDSLYGASSPSVNVALDKLRRDLRFHGDRAKMWIGSAGAVGEPVSFPQDPANDLLRLGTLLESSNSDLNPADLVLLPDAEKAVLLDENDEPVRTRAIIGDGRNDENLFIAQLHMAFLRFHNRVVDAFPGGRTAGDEDEVFAWAAGHVRHFYQWLILNTFLPTICDPRVVSEILQNGPILYEHLLDQTGWSDGDPLPMPMEFSSAAFRFGHSMVRSDYDWNEHFGRGDNALVDRASFTQLFEFTGGGKPEPFGGLSETLPRNWVADWDRLVHPITTFTDRSTRRIDTKVSFELADMRNEPEGTVNRNLLARNLRRGMLHNLPTAQSIIAGLADLGISVDPLTQDQLRSGQTAGEVAAGGFHLNTPLWFYVLKEAEVLNNGLRLGPLGSHIVAGTLLGLMHRTPGSVLSTPGSVNGLWHPIDGPRVSGQVVDSFPAFIRAALLSANPDV